MGFDFPYNIYTLIDIYRIIRGFTSIHLVSQMKIIISRLLLFSVSSLLMMSVDGMLSQKPCSCCFWIRFRLCASSGVIYRATSTKSFFSLPQAPIMPRFSFILLFIFSFHIVHLSLFGVHWFRFSFSALHINSNELILANTKQWKRTSLFYHLRKYDNFIPRNSLINKVYKFFFIKTIIQQQQQKLSYSFSIQTMTVSWPMTTVQDLQNNDASTNNVHLYIRLYRIGKWKIQSVNWLRDTWCDGTCTNIEPKQKKPRPLIHMAVSCIRSREKKRNSHITQTYTFIMIILRNTQK